MTAPMPPVTEDALSVGSRVSHYEIKSVISYGGMGIVYRAVDLNLDREVALKCIRPDRAENPDYRKRLLREVRIVSRLSDPNIVRVMDVLEINGLPAIVMELIHGSNLRTHINNKGALPLDEVLSFAEDIAHALVTAHSVGVLHRDVNPNNVLISSDGRALLTDFGLSRRAVGSDPDGQLSGLSTVSAPGTILGTMGYMSPEQVLGRPLDSRSDIFSFGLVLYEMCTGTRAFPPSSASELIDATLNHEPTPITRLNYEIPADLEHVVRKALAKRADERYQDIRELYTDIRTIRRRFVSGLSMIVPPPEKPRLRRRFYLALAFAATAVTAVSIWLGISRLGNVELLPAMTPRQLTNEPGLETDPAISPDGSFVAYASDASGNFDIWITDVTSGQSLRLTDDPAVDRQPTWFPDSSGIAFVSERGRSTGIWKTTRLGGPAVSLIPNAMTPAISPDGNRIAFARPPSEESSEIWAVELVKPDQAQRLTSTKSGFWSRQHPTWSRDGKKICFEDFDGLWVIPATGGEPTRLTNREDKSREADWSPDGKHIYFSSTRNGNANRSLWRIDANGRNPQRVSLGTGNEGLPSICKDGKRIAYSTKQLEPRLVLFNLKTLQRSPINGLRPAVAPLFSTDGTRLVFRPSTSTNNALMFLNIVDGQATGSPQQFSGIEGIGTYSVSPDGRWLAYHRNVDGKRHIWISPVGSGAPWPLLDSTANEINPAWSPDGRRIAFVSDREEDMHIWVIEVREGRAYGSPMRMTGGRGRDLAPSWLPDGRIVFLREENGTSEVWVVATDGNHIPTKITDDAKVKEFAWCPFLDALVVSGTWGTRDTEIRQVRIRDGEAIPFSPRLVIGDDQGYGEVCASPTSPLLALIEEWPRGDIWLIEAERGRL